MITELFLGAAKSYAQMRGRITHYEIQHDGTIQHEFIDPSNTEEKAWDLEDNPEQQISVKGYANSCTLTVKEGSNDVELVPSGRYKQYMENHILSQTMQAGSMDSQKMMYLSIANLATLLLFGIIGLSIIT